MRFLLKIGFWLALIAFFLPGGGEDGREGVNTFGAFVGAQQAISDLGGFCERSPAACEAGRDVGHYVASRVGDGLSYGYALVQGTPVTVREDAAPRSAIAAAVPARATPAAPASIPASAQASNRPAPAAAVARPAPSSAPSPTDPMQTAAVAAERVRQAAGLTPFAMPAMEQRAARASGPLPSNFVHAGNARSIPTPTPRP